MAKAIQIPYQYQVDVPVSTAQAVQKNSENPISLEALGLLINLLSYPTTWELHKTELYKRFGKHGERSVKSAWNDLMDANYIIEFRYRDGKKWEYVYYFRKVPFTVEEKADILANAEKEFGEIWGLQNEDLKVETSKCRDNQKTLLNQNTILNNNDIQNIDDDKRTKSSITANLTDHKEDEINLIISNLRESIGKELTKRSFDAIVRKVVDKYNQGKVNSFRDYLTTSLNKKIEELELRRVQENTKKELQELAKARSEKRTKNTDVTSTRVPFYNWLEER